MEQESLWRGHFCAIFTMLVWGTTYISTKILLADFQPVEILFFRFFMGLLVLFIVYPRRLHVKDKRQELFFALAGLCGICFYYLLENIALTYTMASNVGVLVSVTPFFTALLAHFITREDRLRLRFLLGFLVAMAGILLISLNSVQLQINPLGDFLALAAAFVWACYSLLTRQLAGYGYNTIQTTRRVFSYGLLFMLPFLFLFDFQLDLERFASPVNLFNILFLGLGASALCFVTWGYAVRLLGAVQTSAYIYAVPVITVVTSAVVLGENITGLAVTGTLLTLAGLLLSEGRLPVKGCKTVYKSQKHRQSLRG